jgi:hypothetical protein
MSSKEAAMWRLLKGEINYDRLRIIPVYLFCVACFITIWYGVQWERNRAPLAMLILLVSTIIIVSFGEKNRIIQKRDRLHVSLPLSPAQIGAAHLIYPFLVWLSLALLFYLTGLLVQPFYAAPLTMPSLMQFLTLNGLVMIISAMYRLYRDLRMNFNSKQQRFLIFLFWFIVYIAALAPFYIVTNFFGLFGENTALQQILMELSASPAGFNILGGLLWGLSLWFFKRRNSYALS